MRQQTLDVDSILAKIRPGAGPATPAGKQRPELYHSVLSPTIFRDFALSGTDRLLDATTDHSVWPVSKSTFWPDRLWRTNNANRVVLVNLNPDHVALRFPPHNKINHARFPFGFCGNPWMMLLEEEQGPAMVCVPVGDHAIDPLLSLYRTPALSPALVVSGFKGVYNDTLKQVVSSLNLETDPGVVMSDPTKECLVCRVILPGQLPPDVLAAVRGCNNNSNQIGRLLLDKYSFSENPGEVRGLGKPHIGDVSHLCVLPLGSTLSPLNYMGPMPSGQLSYARSFATWRKDANDDVFFPGGAHCSSFKGMRGYHLGFSPDGRAWYSVTKVDVEQDMGLLRSFCDITKFANTPWDEKDEAPLTLRNATSHAHHYGCNLTDFFGPARKTPGRPLALADLPGGAAAGSAAGPAAPPSLPQQPPVNRTLFPPAVQQLPQQRFSLEQFGVQFNPKLTSDDIEALSPTSQGRHWYLMTCFNKSCNPFDPSLSVQSTYLSLCDDDAKLPRVIPQEFRAHTTDVLWPHGGATIPAGGGGVGLGVTTSPKHAGTPGSVEAPVVAGASTSQSVGSMPVPAGDEHMGVGEGEGEKGEKKQKKRKADVVAPLPPNDGSESDSSVGSRRSARLQKKKVKKIVEGGAGQLTQQ